MTSEESVRAPSEMRQLMHSPVTWVLLLPVAMIAVIGVLLYLRNPAKKLPVLSHVPAFTLEDQHAKPFASASLRGKAWIANFIFTRCELVCPLTTAKMADVQRRLGADSGVQLLSFSVDPQYDTPERLRKYAVRFNADQSNWSFLRGTRRTMKRIVSNGFKIGMGIIGIKDDSDTDTTNVKQSDMVHGEHFVLVDNQLRIRGYYVLDDNDSINRLVRDARSLAGN